MEKQTEPLTVEMPEDIIIEKVSNGQIPSPDDVADFFGADEVSLETFYFTNALFDNVFRRDGKRPAFLHSYRVAKKLGDGSNEIIHPSGEIAANLEKQLGMIHETREDVGNGIVGSYVLGDISEGFFGSGLADGLEYLTNTNAMVMNLISKQLRNIEITNKDRFVLLGQSEISDMLHKKADNFRVSEKEVIGHYNRILKVLKGYARNVHLYHPELDLKQKNFIIDLMNSSFMDPLLYMVGKKDTIDIAKLDNTIGKDIDHVIRTVDNGELVPSDPRLVLPSESEYLKTLYKSLYVQFLNPIMQSGYDTLINGLEDGLSKGDYHLSLPIVKVKDGIAVILEPESDTEHRISQFRKARRILGASSNLIATFEEEVVDPQFYKRFQVNCELLYESHVWSTILRYISLRAKNQREVELFKYMLSEKLDIDPKEIDSELNLSKIHDKLMKGGFGRFY